MAGKDRLWFSAAEIAAAGLPGVPGTKQNVIARAKREGWKSRPRRGRGGGREYYLPSAHGSVAAAQARKSTAKERLAMRLRLVLARRIEAWARRLSRIAALLRGRTGGAQ